MLWTSSIKSKATGIALGASSLGIHLHPALLIERRKDFDLFHNFPLTKVAVGSSNTSDSSSDTCVASSTDDSNTTGQQQLYLREYCDAGTVVAIIPNTAMITLENLRRRGVAAATSIINNNNHDNNTMTNNYDPFGKLIGAPSKQHWREFCWRLALEVSCSSSAGWISPWWYWVEMNKELSSSSSSSSSLYHHLEQQALQFYRLGYPAVAGDAIDVEQKFRTEILDEEMFRKEVLMKSTNAFPVLPNNASWRFAVDALLYKSLLTFDSSQELLAPSILPIVDLCAHSSVSSASNHYYSPNVTLTIIEKEKEQQEGENSNSSTSALPDWVSEQKKQDIYQDAREERALREDEEFTDDDDDKKKKNSIRRKGPRKPRITPEEKMELKIQQQQTMNRTSKAARRRKQLQQKLRRGDVEHDHHDSPMMKASASSGFVPMIDYYFALELTRPLGPGEMLRLDWQELSPIISTLLESDEQDQQQEIEKKNKEIRDFYSWMRYRVVPGI